MTRKLFFLPLVLLFISCTVTKRVHRPGFHVQWHKIQRTQKPDLPTKEPLISSSVQQTDDTEEMQLPTRQIEVKKTLILPDLSVPNIQSKQTKTAIKRTTEIISHTITPPQKRPSESINIRQQNTRTSKHQLRRPLFWRLDAKSLKTIGTILISIGVLIFFGALLSTTGAFMGGGNGNGAVWANFFLDLIEISGWFWLLVFILIIILLLYLAVLLVRYVFLSEFIGLMVGLVLIGLGIFFVVLGNNREIEP